MFFEASAPVADTSVRAPILVSAYDNTTRARASRPDMACRGLWSTTNDIAHEPRPCVASDSSRLAPDEMNSNVCLGRAVAAATGRRFKSYSDFDFGKGRRHDGSSCISRGCVSYRTRLSSLSKNRRDGRTVGRPDVGKSLLSSIDSAVAAGP